MRNDRSYFQKSGNHRQASWRPGPSYDPKVDPKAPKKSLKDAEEDQSEEDAAQES